MEGERGEKKGERALELEEEGPMEAAAAEDGRCSKTPKEQHVTRTAARKKERKEIMGPVSVELSPDDTARENSECLIGHHHRHSRATATGHSFWIRTGNGNIFIVIILKPLMCL